MTTRNTNFPKLKLAVVAALVGLAVLILLGSADATGMPASCPVGTLVGAALQTIPCVLAQAGLQTLLACLFDHRAFLQDFQRMLVSFWLLLFVVAGTALLRSRFTSKSEGSSTPSKDFWRIGIGDVDPVGHRSTYE
jgi:hypothetical protein